MLRSLLVGVDGSASGEAAIALAIRWARAFDAALFGIAVIDRPTICAPEPVPLGGMAFKGDRDEALVAEAHRKVEYALQSFTATCAEAGVSGVALENVGLPAEEIMREAQRYDLILLGQRTYFQFETQSSPDSTLQQVVKSSPRPVVAVPETPRAGDNVVLAWDGSAQAARTLQAFQGLGLHRPHAIHVVCVHPDLTEANRCAGRAMDYLRFHEIAAFSHPVAGSESAADAILEQVNALNAGLLVMGAYGQSTLREFLFGSVTQNVLDRSPVPVFLYH
jgi:nucleotide-binding universal stress UspA family protein